MEGHRFSRLTEGQRACLKLVYQHMSSKQIARELGISKDTVDQRLDRARRLIGASTRIEAARAFAAHESEYHQMVYEADRIAPAAPSMEEFPDRQEAQPGTPGLRIQEAREDYRAFPSVARRGLRLPLAWGEERNDLGTWERLGWIAIIAVAIPLLLGSLLGGLWALEQIAMALKR